MRNRCEHKVIIGDFNLALDPELDRLNTYNNNNKAKRELENLMDEFYLKDVWRTQNETKKEYSWYKKGNLMKASRLDFALVSAGLDQKVKVPQYLAGILTDHRAFYMVLETEPAERGSGYWKLNTSLLQENDFIQQVNRELDKTIATTTHQAPDQRWEHIKKRVKKVTNNYARNKSKEDKLIISQLKEIITDYETQLPLNREENELLEKTKKDLDEKVIERAKGVMFRSKVKWYEEGEKNTKYFYSLEKARYNSKTCFKLINDEDREIEEQTEIIKEQKTYFEKLYSEDPEVKFNMENNYNVKVPEEIKTQQNQQITIQELENAIKTMNNNKTPGEDGLPVEFYKVFWTKIKNIFYEMVLWSHQTEILHQSARTGILNLIPKPNKDSRYIKNLRPITLLNVDYKIIEKAIANKMMPALEYIINKDQRGFMKDRRISVNIRKMLDIMHQVDKEDLEAVVLSLDFVKCFDKCSFDILHGSLDFFGFGKKVKEWTKILYKDFAVKIQNNGHFSDSFDIKKGVHQGGCCSSVYFLVIAEILALTLRDNDKIEGITIKDIKNLLNQFADDMDIFSKATAESIKAILEELDKFKLQSGFTVSYEKTTLYRIGSLKHSDSAMYSIDQVKWSNKDINVLGITIAHDNIIEKNYANVVQKAKETLNAWYNRGLSLIGRVQVVNTLIASMFVYKMMVLPCIPPNIVKNMDNVIRDFLWKGKK